MLRQERYESPTAAVETALTGRQTKIWTALPGIVESYNAKDNTVVVQPAVKGKQKMVTGELKDVDMPLCQDVPVHFPSAGGYALTFPVKKGDECLLIFSSRCIDGWWGKGGVQPNPMVSRLHDLSDGFAIIGTRSRAKALKEPSTDKVQLRTEDGKTLLEIDAHQTIRLVAATKVRIETPLLEVTGMITAGKDIKAAGDVQANSGGVEAKVSWTATAAQSGDA